MNNEIDMQIEQIVQTAMVYIDFDAVEKVVAQISAEKANKPSAVNQHTSITKAELDNFIRRASSRRLNKLEHSVDIENMSVPDRIRYYNSLLAAKGKG